MKNYDNHTLDYDDIKIDLSYMRPLKAKRQREFYESLEARNGLKLRVYGPCLLRPLGLDINDKYLGEGYIMDDTGFAASIDSAEPGEYQLQGTTLYRGYLRGGWGHFLMGSLARLWPLASSDAIPDVDNILFFAENEDMLTLKGNFLEVFEILGIKDKIKIVYETPVTAEKIYVPDLSFEHNAFYSTEFLELFSLIRRKVLLSCNKTSSRTAKKLFFTRSGLKQAREDEVNLKLMDSFFQDNDFQVLSPEKMAVSELIVAMDEAEVVASFSGSLAHNVVFMSPGKRVWIFERHGMINTFQSSINLMARLNVVHIDAFWMPFLSSQSSHVYIYGLTPQLENFASRHNHSIMRLEKCQSTGHKRRELRQFLRRYRRYYGDSQTLNPWEVDYADAMAEAIVATRQNYFLWLKRFLPVRLSDYFSPFFMWRLIKSVLKRG